MKPLKQEVKFDFLLSYTCNVDICVEVGSIDFITKADVSNIIPSI